jgi:hypothetical protein
VQSLTWKEKKYLDVKKNFVWQLAYIKTKESSDYLKNIYLAAGDTIEMQYTALEALLNQKTSYSYNVFKDIMVTDPPVLDIDESSSRTYAAPKVNFGTGYDYDYSDSYPSGNFLADLSDSLQLTATIFKDLLPLININDYEQPMMELMGTLIDSNLLAAKDYEMYQSKFLIEAKQLLKKQIISEKSKQIEKAQKTDEEKEDFSYYGNDEKDYGNSQLSLYATLLMPFWEKNPAVPTFLNQLLNSNDKRLKYNTTMLLLHNKKAVPDSMFSFFAALDDYRYELYKDLQEKNLLKSFPAKYNNHVDLAKSELLSYSGYNKPDTFVYVDRLPVRHKDRSGYVYFFKYKQKKDDNNWKLASVGIIPNDPKQYSFEKKEKYYEEQQYDFTGMKDVKLDSETPLKDQLKKSLKRMQYAKRNSAAEFYSDEEKGPEFGFMKGLNFGD